MKHIVLATDGTLSVSNGIIYILIRLKRYIKNHNVNVHIIYPSRFSLQKIKKPYPPLLGINISWIPTIEHPLDPYYIQIGISKVFKLLSANDQCLYIDYDHIILDDSFAYILLKNNEKLIVSSELSSYYNELLPIVNAHYNSSIICGTGNSLKRIGYKWNDAYRSIENCTEYRNRTEIALTYLLKKNQIMTEPCSPKIQSCFSNRSSNFSIFHFGGKSPKSYLMKKQLSNVNFLNIPHEKLEKSASNLTERLMQMITIQKN